MEPEWKTLYAVKDTVRNQINPPFIANNEAEAWRNFAISMQHDDWANAHPDEFVLLELADIDVTTGLINMDQLHPNELTQTIGAIEE